VRRRLAAVLLLALAAPALALAADTDPQKKLTAADQAKARTLLLKKSDFVAGWKKEPASPSKDDGGDFSCPNYNPDQSDLVLTGEAEAEFAGPEGIPSVTSVANIYKTRREATTAWARGDRPQLVPCVASVFEKELEKDGSKITFTRKGKIAFPRYSPRTSAYRFSFNVSTTQNGKPLSFPMTMHFVVLGHGRGDVTLMTMSLGPGVALSDLKAFAQRSAQRLAAAKL
jgi:hypothetical protein